jgi:glycosyltransferase involved in cell wall biosynthesis
MYSTNPVMPDVQLSASESRDSSAPAHPIEVSDPVRVLFVWDHLGYPNGATHGLTRYCLNVLPRLNAGPVRMTVCFLREPHPAGEELRRRGIEPIFLGRAKWDPRALLDVVRIVREHRIELVHAVGQKGILAGRTAGRLLGCGTIIHLRDIFPLNPVLRMILRAGAGWTDVAQGVSRAVCQYASDRYGVPRERIELLYNGVLPEQFPPLRPGETQRWRGEHGFAETDLLVGVVGRLAPEKGHARLFRQFVRVRARHPGARLVVAGDGPLRGELEALAVRLGIAEFTRFLGQQDDARALIGALDVLAVPSDHEGLSFVGLEALMLGTPVVGTEVGGLAEVLKEGEHGVLFSPSREEGLGDGLIWTLQHPAEARRRATSATEHLRLFDMEEHVRRQHEIYIRLGRDVRQRRRAGRGKPSSGGR